MIVKKYEARSMKEALDMVKAELGPEAIILGAKDNSRRYGLVGDTSVEITAAIHEENYRKKKLVESKLPKDIRDKVHQGSAKAQRELIEKAMARKEAESQSKIQNRIASAPPHRYQEGRRSPSSEVSFQSQTLPDQKKPKPTVRAERYIDMADDLEAPEVPTQLNQKMKQVAQKAWTEMQKRSQADFIEIKRELSSLKELFVHSEKVPQDLTKTYPGSEIGLGFEFSAAYQRLREVGVQKERLDSILIQLQKELNSKFGTQREWNSAHLLGLISKALADQVKILDLSSKSEAEKNVSVLIGASGHGKTSTLIKWASQLVLQHQKSVAIISTDNKKFGASEQLKIYSQILNVPFILITESLQWEVLRDQFEAFDHILVDTAGVRFRDVDEMDELGELMPPKDLDSKVHLVLSATSKDQDAFEIGKRFSRFGFSDVIFTALDQSSQHGVIFNFQNQFQCPLHSFGIGTRIPEDFEIATKERVIDLLLGPLNHLLMKLDTTHDETHQF